MLIVPDIWAAKAAAARLQETLKYGHADPDVAQVCCVEMAVGLGMPTQQARESAPTALLMFILSVLVGAAQ